MLAYLTEGTEKAARKRIRGVSFWVTPMPMTGKLAKLRRRRQWKKLRRLGIRRAIFPPALAQEAEQWKIGRVAVYPLRRAVYEQLLPQSGNLALLRADAVNTAVRESAMDLARRFRYLRLETGRGTEDLAKELLRRYGLGAGGCGEADAVLSFGGKPTFAEEICLGEDCANWQQVEYADVAGLEDAVFSEELLCALFQGGGVKKEEIRIKAWKTLTFRETK